RELRLSDGAPGAAPVTTTIHPGTQTAIVQTATIQALTATATPTIHPGTQTAIVQTATIQALTATATPTLEPRTATPAAQTATVPAQPGTPTPPLSLPAVGRPGTPGVPCTTVVGGTCSISGGVTGTWTKTGSGAFRVTGSAPAGALAGIPAI